MVVTDEQLMKNSKEQSGLKEPKRRTSRTSKTKKADPVLAQDQEEAHSDNSGSSSLQNPSQSQQFSNNNNLDTPLHKHSMTSSKEDVPHKVGETMVFENSPDVNDEDELSSSPNQSMETTSSFDNNLFSLKISKSLFKKIAQQAADEGLTIEEFASELLAEGVVVRAWEIAERKNQMRGQPTNQVNNRNSNHQFNRNGGNNNTSNNGNGGQRKPHHRNGMSHTRYQSIMDDKATFLEYVRAQERNRR
jgi:hypothetical protein